jgi:hypothetical protein
VLLYHLNIFIFESSVIFESFILGRRYHQPQIRIVYSLSVRVDKPTHFTAIESLEMGRCNVGGEIEVSNNVDGDSPAKSFSVIGPLSFVDRFLSLWIISVMVIGVVVGFYSPETQSELSRIEG